MGEQKESIEERGWQLVLVHMGDSETGIPGIDESKLSGIPQIADPDCELYRSFGLGKGTLWQLTRPKVWIRGVGAAIRGHGGGKLQGDGLQLPGMFLVRDGEVIDSHIGTHAADNAEAILLTD